MPVDIVMPQAGESVTSGVISRWLKNDGEFVKRDEGVIEVETDKVTLEVPATATGVLMGLKVKAGDTVQIGQVLASIDENAAASAAPAAAPKAAAAGATAVAEPKATTAASAAQGRHRRRPRHPARQKARRRAGRGHLPHHRYRARGRVREQDVMAFVAQSRPWPPPPHPRAGRPRRGSAAPAKGRRHEAHGPWAPARSASA